VLGATTPPHRARVRIGRLRTPARTPFRLAWRWRRLWRARWDGAAARPPWPRRPA